MVNYFFLSKIILQTTLQLSTIAISAWSLAWSEDPTQAQPVQLSLWRIWIGKEEGLLLVIVGSLTWGVRCYDVTGSSQNVLKPHSPV